MSKQIIHTDKAPKALGPYSQAVKSGNTLFTSGQIGLDPESGQFVGNDVASQAQQVMKNLEAVLQAGGFSLSDVVKCSIFLADMADFKTVNEIYGVFFPEFPPARETVAVKELPAGALVEISCIASR